MEPTSDETALRRRTGTAVKMSSREALAIDSPEPTTFSRASGWFVTRTCALLLALLCLAAITVTALLVHYSAPAPHPFKDTATVNRAPIGGASAAPVSDKVRDVRLPLHLIPKTYKIQLLPFIEEGNFTFSGKVVMTLRVAAAGRNVTVHVRNMTVHNAAVTVTDVTARRQLRITGHQLDADREFHVLLLDRDVVVGHELKVFMPFTGNLNDKLAGFYRSSYMNAQGEKRWLGVTQFQPTDARRAFPCLDEPALKASFEVTLGRRKTMTSVSNMPINRTEPNKDLSGYEWDIYQKSVPMSTYLVAFIVSDLAVKEADAGLSDTLFRVWARPEAIDQGDYARTIGPAILEYYEDFFSTEFPLPKQDMAALPDFSAGAMENWGLITYRETALLYDPLVASTRARQRVASVVAHELAHQWFGNLVTPSWWTDLWLNEGFATYMQNLGMNKVEPTWRMMDQFVTRTQQRVMATDALQSSHPVSVVVRHPDEIGSIFDSISYLKGASLIRMMDHMLTSSTLRRGLTNYLNDRKYQAADQDDLWQFLTDQAHRDSRLPPDVTVKRVMDTWTLQTGFPVVDVKRDYAHQRAVLTQRRFLLSGADASDETLWWIPLRYTTEDVKDFNSTIATHWMKKQRQITIDGLPSADKWMLLNVRSVGYYKVNYDKRNWDLLISQLQREHTAIHPANRAQLLDDALTLARSGLLGYDTALTVMGYLNREEDFLPWDAVFSNLKYLDAQLSRSPAYGLFKKFILKLMRPLYERLGFEARPGDSHLDHDTRISLLNWACEMGHADCVRRATDTFARWMAHPTNDSIVPVNIKFTVYCTAIAKGGEEEWQFAWSRYQAANVATQKNSLLYALGCTKEIWLLNRYLQWIITPGSGVRIQDGSVVYTAVAGNSIGRFLAWDFLRSEWPTIVKRYSSGIFTLSRFVAPLKDGYNTPLELEQMKRFYEKQKDNLNGAERELKQAIEVTSTNVAWMKKNYNTISKWLAKQ